jgi:hypothetical protein
VPKTAAELKQLSAKQLKDELRAHVRRPGQTRPAGSAAARRRGRIAGARRAAAIAPLLPGRAVLGLRPEADARVLGRG